MRLARTLLIAPLGALAMLACNGGRTNPNGSIAVAEKTEPALSTKAIMDRAHKGKGSLLSRLEADLQKPQPDLANDGEYVAEMIRLVTGLGTQKPPQGTQDAWNARVQGYLEKANDIARSLKEQDAQAARPSLGRLRATCKDCHEAHNPQ
jgi:hypothetical protein